ncbi:MAG: ABC transporter permease [Bacteroidales bacterium]|nr:ABC transporter permease [Bacteroidales bacterium]
MDKISTIKPKRHLFDINLKEIWEYRDLLWLFVRREIVVVYKQTIMGPLWFFIQPLITTIMFLVVFNGIAGIPTDGVPPILFYLGGLTAWNYFAESFRNTSDTFTKNAGIFGKVYFPRVVMPLSVVISNLIKFAIQMLLFLGVYFYYYFTIETIHPNTALFLLPVLILLMAMLGLSFGMVISSLTTKYRDLKFLIQFAVQLWMYATPVIYPMSKIPEKYQAFIMLNPLTSIIEAFKYSFTGAGTLSYNGLLYSSCFALGMLLLGILIFNKTEQNFMDTV